MHRPIEPYLVERLGAGQGLTLAHFSAQRKRCLWDRGSFRGGCLGRVRKV